MSKQTTVAPVPRLALDRPDAAKAVGVSLSFFEEHVQPDLRLIRVGRKRLAPVAELERWVAENAAIALDADRAAVE